MATRAAKLALRGKALSDTGTEIGIVNNADATAITIDSNENVGIGTSSPSAKLQISSTYPTFTLDETNTDAAYQQTQLALDDGSFRIQTRTSTNVFVSNDYIIEKDASGAADHIWKIANTERMRIDSSGNLLVGTQNTTWASQEGLRYFNGSSLIVTRDSDEPLNLNRLTNDGQIISLKKDGTTVGSIGTVGGDLVVGSTDTALRFHDLDNRIYPVNVSGGTKVDGAVDLGDPTGRFKDLYLSGETKVTSTGVDGTYAPILRGIYSGNANETNSIETTVSSNATGSGFKFNVSNGGGSAGQTEALRITRAGTYAPLGLKLGGTGAANTLDDYEEGTWTPTVAYGTVAHSNTTYTKIGRIVHATTRLSNFSDVTSNQHVRIGGLPFSVSGTDQHIGSAWGNFANKSLWCYSAGTTESPLYYGGTSPSSYGPVYYSSFSSGDQVIVQFTYKT